MQTKKKNYSFTYITVFKGSYLLNEKITDQYSLPALNTEIQPSSIAYLFALPNLVYLHRLCCIELLSYLNPHIKWRMVLEGVVSHFDFWQKL